MELKKSEIFLIVALILSVVPLFTFATVNTLLHYTDTASQVQPEISGKKTQAIRKIDLIDDCKERLNNSVTNGLQYIRIDRLSTSSIRSQPGHSIFGHIGVNLSEVDFHCHYEASGKFKFGEIDGRSMAALKRAEGFNKMLAY